MASPGARAAPPALLGHQGRIVVDNVNHDGPGFFKFSLVKDAGSSGEAALWHHDGTAVSSGEPAGSVELAVAGGHYGITLGAVSMTQPLDPAAFAAEPDLSLRVWFSTTGGAGTFELLSPDLRLLPAGYAFAASFAEEVADGSVTAAKIAPSYEAGGAGELELSTLAPGGEVLAEATFARAFSAVPTVELADGWAVETAGSTGFTASSSFRLETLDAAGVVGADASLAEVGGLPAVAYRDQGKGDLLYARGGSVARVAGATSSAGFYASLALVAGRPAVSYFDSSLGALRFARAGDANGASWPPGNIVTVDFATPGAGWYGSLAVVGAVPAIAYYDPNAGDLKYAFAADAAGTAWPAANVMTIDGDAADDGQFASLAVVGGLPAVAYFDATNAEVRFARLDGAGGTWRTVAISTGGTAGGHCSLAVVGGVPCVAYYDAAGGDLLFARAGDAAGMTWPAGNRVPVDTAGDVGQHASLVEVSGRPATAYHDRTNGDLKLALGDDDTGSSWTRTAVDGSAANVGAHASLAVVGGLPAVAYQDGGAFDLKLATLPPASWTATLGGPLPVQAEGVADGAVGWRQLSMELADELRRRDAVIEDLRARLEALEARR